MLPASPRPYGASSSAVRDLVAQVEFTFRCTRVPSWRRTALAFALVGGSLLASRARTRPFLSGLAAVRLVCSCHPAAAPAAYARLLLGPFAVAHRARSMAAPQRVRPCPFSAASRIRAWPRPGCKRLGLSDGGSLSLARGFGAGGTLGHGWYSAHDRQRSPSFVHMNE